MGEIVKTEMFDDILNMIYSAKKKAEFQVNSTVIDLYWNIGEYVSNKAESDGWGKSTVKALSDYILSKEPGIRGYSSQNIWRMKQFYETYKDHPELSTLLRENTWSNNMHIVSKTKDYQEKKFYLELASKEKYQARELARQIDSGYYERILLSNGKAPSALEPKKISGVLRDMYMLEFLDLPEPYKEFDLKKAILRNMKKFLLEFGRDFLFVGEEYHVQVGNNDYYVDLLFYHRELQCLVAIDLKIDDFKPEYMGKMDFYLEALDRDVKKPHENPSVGMILCKNADTDVVEYSLSRSLSQTMISEYKTKLISKDVLREKLAELYNIAEEESENSQQR
ncbi:PDDEXK nuclease domain-containing protein [Pseudobutyrivibrio sp.]|uniref:PDDEXK nuclease domain-containing protein n=1 Tax=Pseudobutyrivibrio sp. TaxID=2014367 RepID=UPI002ED3FB5C